MEITGVTSALGNCQFVLNADSLSSMCTFLENVCEQTFFYLHNYSFSTALCVRIISLQFSGENISVCVTQCLISNLLEVSSDVATVVANHPLLFA